MKRQPDKHLPASVHESTWAVHGGNKIDQGTGALRTQVQVMPGDSVEVNLFIAARSCSIMDQNGQRIVEPGSFELPVGRNRHDPRTLSAQFRITP